jgi:hypothetical protein
MPNFMPCSPGGVHLVGVGGAELLDGGQREQRLLLVDLGHGEADVHEHPLVGLREVALQ